MRTITLLTLVPLITAVLSTTGFAQAPADKSSPEQAAITALEHAFEAAYAKADIKALGDFFADDADYTTDEGRSFSGRAEIEGALKEGLMANRGAKLDIQVQSVRALGPDTIIEKGSTTVTSKSGETSGALYTAVHVKKDGKWKILQLVETPLPTITPRDHLQELAWLVGSWEESDKSNDLTISSLYSWARGGNFLTRSITVKRAGNVTLEGWQIIGWDPIQERLHSWTFDGEGGYADGYFTRDGNRWLLRESGVTPDGNRTGSDSTISKVAADKFTWESNNRTLDGEPQPGIGRIEISRVKGN